MLFLFFTLSRSIVHTNSRTKSFLSIRADYYRSPGLFQLIRKCDNYLFNGKIEIVDSSGALYLVDSRSFLSTLHVLAARLERSSWSYSSTIISTRYLIQNDRASSQLPTCYMCCPPNFVYSLRTGRESKGRGESFESFDASPGTFSWNFLINLLDTVGRITVSRYIRAASRERSIGDDDRWCHKAVFLLQNSSSAAST